MQEENFSPEASLQVIDSMINKARGRFSENGHLYLLWGWVILICSLGHFLLEQVWHYDKPWIVWYLTWITVIYQVIYIIRKNKKQKVKTYTDDIIKYVWLVFAICTVLLVVLGVQNAKDPGQADMAILVMYGMPTFLCGIIFRFRPLIIGAICCWALSLLSLAIPPMYYMLLITAAMIVAWIVPGYLLQKKYRQEKN